MAQRLLEGVPQLHRFIVVALGGRVPVKDWGTDNWVNVLASVSAAHPGLGAVFIGSGDERERNEFLSAAWAGPTINSCGQLTPRETAALMQGASLFLGHDSGPLHLAAALGIRIVALFCARDVPGKWFSDRAADRFFYNRPPCFGCGLTQVADCPNNMACMTAHNTEEIISATTQMLANVEKQSNGSHPGVLSLRTQSLQTAGHDLNMATVAGYRRVVLPKKGNSIARY